MAEKTIFKEKVEDEIKTPKMYKVILLNDDYTTMEFVVRILMSVFNKSAIEAEKIMFDVHYKGKGIVGLYTYDIAKTKVLSVERIAKNEEYPLKAIMEEE
jgi:ATP-dependent Clp protease adaptor protein ClpS